MRAVAASGPGAALPVMVNGVTGKMGFATAEAAVQRGLHLLPVAFSGPSLCPLAGVDLLANWTGLALPCALQQQPEQGSASPAQAST